MYGINTITRKSVYFDFFFWDVKKRSELEEVLCEDASKIPHEVIMEFAHPNKYKYNEAEVRKNMRRAFAGNFEIIRKEFTVNTVSRVRRIVDSKYEVWYGMNHYNDRYSDIRNIMRDETLLKWCEYFSNLSGYNLRFTHETNVPREFGLFLWIFAKKIREITQEVDRIFKMYDELEEKKVSEEYRRNNPPRPPVRCPGCGAAFCCTCRD